MYQFWKDLWKDPVWSKVIAVGIISLLSFLLRIFWKRIETIRSLIAKEKSHPISTDDYFNNSMFVDLFINNYDKTIFYKLYGHKQDYIDLIGKLQKDGLVILDKAGLPYLSPKGRKWIAQHLDAN